MVTRSISSRRTTSAPKQRQGRQRNKIAKGVIASSTRSQYRKMLSQAHTTGKPIVDCVPTNPIPTDGRTMLHAMKRGNKMKPLSVARQLRGEFSILPDFPHHKYEVRSFHANALMSGTMPKPKNKRTSLFFSVPVRSMFIQTDTTPNPNSIKFLPGRVVLDERFTSGVDFTPKAPELRLSPLAKDLLAIHGVIRVFFGKDYISVTKEDDIEWDLLRAQIFAAIMDFYASGKPVMSDEPIVTDTTILDDDDEVVAMIKELLETRIRPAVQDDGGDIFYRGFDEETGIVKLQLAGSCAGCPSSSVTLKNGVENMLMHYIPEVKGIEEVEDEALKEINAKEFMTMEDKLRAAGIPSL